MPNFSNLASALSDKSSLHERNGPRMYGTMSSTARRLRRIPEANDVKLNTSLPRAPAGPRPHVWAQGGRQCPSPIASEGDPA